METPRINDGEKNGEQGSADKSPASILSELAGKFNRQAAIDAQKRDAPQVEQQQDSVEAEPSKELSPDAQREKTASLRGRLVESLAGDKPTNESPEDEAKYQEKLAKAQRMMNLFDKEEYLLTEGSLDDKEYNNRISRDRLGNYIRDAWDASGYAEGSFQDLPKEKQEEILDEAREFRDWAEKNPTELQEYMDERKKVQDKAYETIGDVSYFYFSSGRSKFERTSKEALTQALNDVDSIHTSAVEGCLEKGADPRLVASKLEGPEFARVFDIFMKYQNVSSDMIAEKMMKDRRLGPSSVALHLEELLANRGKDENGNEIENGAKNIDMDALAAGIDDEALYKKSEIMKAHGLTMTPEIEARIKQGKKDWEVHQDLWYNHR